MYDILERVQDWQAIQLGWSAMADLFARYMGRPDWVAAGFALGLGVLLTFAGRATFLFAAFLIGGLAGAHYAHTEGHGGLAGAGYFALGGGLAILAFYVAAFLLGFGLVATLLEPYALHEALTLLLAVGGGVTAIAIIEVLVVISTAFAGSILLVSGIAHANALLELNLPITAMNPQALAQSIFSMTLTDGPGAAIDELGVTGLVVIITTIIGISAQFRRRRPRQRGERYANAPAPLARETGALPPLSDGSSPDQRAAS